MCDKYNQVCYSNIFWNFIFESKICFISFYIFSRIGDHYTNKKFKQALRIYILCSFVFCTNELIIGTHWFAITKVMYELPGNFFPFHPSYALMFHFTYIRTNLSSLSYVFGSLVEIFITWGRIQIFKPNYTFLLNTSVRFYSLVFCLIKYNKHLCFEI